MADTVKTNQQIDMLNEFRKDRGEEPLPYETVDGNANINAENTDIKPEDKKEDIDLGTNKDDDNKPKDIPPAKVELTKEEQEDIVRKYLGITDLNEVIKKSEIKKEPTPDEIEAAKQQRENDKIAYALKNGKFTTKQFENFIADSKAPVDLVLSQYTKEQKEIDPTLTDIEIEEEFNSKHGLDGKEDSRQYKRGLKEIGILADNILKATYGKIYEVDSDFSSYENEQLTQKQLAEKLTKEAPHYKQTVEDIYNGLRNIPIDLGNGEKYEVEMPDEVIASFKQRELATDYAATQIKGGYTKEGKAEAAKMAIIIENLPSIIKSVADKIVYKKQAGSKGIPPLDGTGKQPEPKKLTEAQQKEVDRIYGKELPVAN